MPKINKANGRFDYLKIDEKIIILDLECPQFEHEFDLAHARLHVKKMKSFMKTGKNYCLIVDARKAYGGFDIEALKHIANADEINSQIYVTVFIANSLSVRLVVSFYRRVFGNGNRFQGFSTLEEGLAYCRSIEMKANIKN